MTLVSVSEGQFVSGIMGKEIWELSREQWIKSV
jgi:hypothetical protein